MNSYMVLKVTRQRAGQHSAIFADLSNGGKKQHISGNLPDLYTNMIIQMTVKDGRAIDYELNLTEKNIACLQKYGIDVDKYRKTLNIHSQLKEDGAAWNIASVDMESENGDIYQCLPFAEADKVHRKMINNPTDAKRLQALNKETLEIARNGHRKIAYGVEEFLSYFSEAEREGAYQQLMIHLKVLCLQAQAYSFREGKVWDNEMKHKEDFVFENIVDRCDTDYPICTREEIERFIKTLKEQGSNLCDEQIATLWSLDCSLPCIITGGAGTGKTSVIKAIIDCYSQYYKRENILLVAPTGKASRRLAEKTKLSAMTIHRALRKVPDDEFVYYHSKNPLPHRLVIVDESSMIDTALMYDLLSAVSSSSKIIFVGDHNQLYPVGYGEPFFDFLHILEEKKCVYKLSQNHRQAEGTDILNVANAVLRDEYLGDGVGAGVRIQTVRYNDLPNYFAFDEQTQMLSPYNKLNDDINTFMRRGNAYMNVGDKVIAMKNTEDYCNGDIGYITAVDNKRGTMTVNFEGRSVVIKGSHKCDISLAYSITIHKMQGSESDRVIVFLPKNDRFIEKRMLYTAVTRARKQLEIYYYEY